MSEPQETSSKLSPKEQVMFVESSMDNIETSIPAQFEKIAQRYPERLAVGMGTRSLSYGELNRQANRIAYALRKTRGDEQGPVALLFNHEIDAITAILGVLKSGNYFVALDPSFPEERLRYILTDTQASVMLASGPNSDTALELKIPGCTALRLDDCDKYPDSNRDVVVAGDNLAVVTYTSGSTGIPKGARITHKSLLSKFCAFSNYKQVLPDDRISLLHSLCFTGSHADLLISLLNGAALLLFDVKSAGVSKLAQWLAEERVTLTHLPVMLFRELATLFAGQAAQSSLRLVHLSGAPVTERDFNLYLETFNKSVRLEIGMGSTETGPICHVIIGHDFSFPKEGTPIGYAVPGRTVLLVDESGGEVGVNQIGEIAVKSRYLIPGYWNSPELDTDKFRSDSGDGERTYLTGDLGKMLPDGFFVHLGRKDSIVKLRGYRVDLGEIEGALLKYSAVQQAAVVPRSREPGDIYLAAYIVPAAGYAPTTRELRHFLEQKLPDYMIPAVFVRLDAIPLTANNKIDRGRLPEPEKIRQEMDPPYVAPRSRVEVTLKLIWSEVLSLDRVGIHDNFFDLGGHSLAASRVISRVIQYFKLDLPLKALFDAPTIAQMAQIVDRYRGAQIADRELAQVLAEVEQTSEQEAQQQLDAKNKTRGKEST